MKPISASRTIVFRNLASRNIASRNLASRYLLCSFAFVLLYPTAIDFYLVALPQIASDISASESQLHIALFNTCEKTQIKRHHCHWQYHRH